LRWQITSSIFRLETTALLVVGLIIGGIVGGFAASSLAQPPAGAVKTFYVLETEWAFALYDNGFKKVEKIKVSRGDIRA